MIEVFDAKRTRSYGCFASFKAATGTLNLLVCEGVSSVFVAAYRNGALQREYDAVYAGGKWRVPKEHKPRLANIAVKPVRKHRKRKLCKEYISAEFMFREGFPDWMNRTYPLSADSLRKCSRKCFIYNRMTA